MLATVGAYGFSALTAMAVARGLHAAGVGRAEAAIWATLLALVVMPLVPLFVFGVGRTRAVTLGFLAAALALTAVAWLIGGPA